MNLQINLRGLISFFFILLLQTPTFAQTMDENQIRELVQKEVERLLSTEGALDAAIEKGIGNYILKKRLATEQAKQAKQQEQAKNLRPVDLQQDHIRGNVDAPITLIEYSDFECPFCKRFHPTVVKLLETNPGKVRWVYRHFPLGFHNPGAQKQAEATECATELGGNTAFWKYSDAIYTRTKSNGKGFPIGNLKPLAEEIGLDGEAFSQCLDSGKFTAQVNEDTTNGSAVGVTGTPAAFILNQKGDVRFVAGALPLPRLQALVNELMK